MVKIEFDTDGAAFRDGDDYLDLWAVATQIDAVANQIFNGATKGNIIDVNGNKVGTFKVTD